MGLLKKDGILDMCYKINREVVVVCFYLSGEFNWIFFGVGCLFCEVLYCFGINVGFKKKDGIFDMCFKVNK